MEINSYHHESYARTFSSIDTLVAQVPSLISSAGPIDRKRPLKFRSCENGNGKSDLSQAWSCFYSSMFSSASFLKILCIQVNCLQSPSTALSGHVLPPEVP